MPSYLHCSMQLWVNWFTLVSVDKHRLTSEVKCLCTDLMWGPHGYVCALKEKMSMGTYNTRVRDHRTDAFIQSKLEKTRQEDLRLSLLPETHLQSAELKIWRPLKTRIEFLISNKSKKTSYVFLFHHNKFLKTFILWKIFIYCDGWCHSAWHRRTLKLMWTILGITGRKTSCINVMK